MKLLGGLLVLSILALPLRAQFSGRVTGSVVDASGSAVPGADVNLLLAGGAKPLLTVKTSGDGLFHFIGVRPTEYDLTVDAPGFVKTTVRGIMVDAARETAVPQLKLQLASVTTSVDVTANLQTVQTTNGEISGTISMEQIRNLPIMDRDVLSVMQTQAGVVYNGNSTTVINGLRTSYSTVTVDGVNVQDNYIRDNALDYLPNKLLLGQVQQMTLVSSNSNAASAGGATETALSTPSGDNFLHGDLFWYNRNSYFSANDWFSNQSGIEKPFLNQNQMGGSLAGPIKKDKLFFYTNYEAIRARQQAPVTTAILTASARAGIFTYNAGGESRTVNLLALRGLTGVEPLVQALIDQTPAADKINDLEVGDGRNIGGYRFNQRNNVTRDNVTGKLDYNLSTNHAISGSYLHNRFNKDRPDASNGFSLIPKTYNPTHADMVAASWRWTPTGRLTNELRGGFNLTYGYFNSLQDFGAYLLAGMAFTNPVSTYMTQGRNTNTYNFSDTAAYQHGRHYFQFGFDAQNIRVETYDASGTVPVVVLGMGFGQPAALTRNNLPGISNTDLATANALLATLGGYYDGYGQTFNVTSRTSGFVPGAPYLRHLILNDYGFYFQDKWRVRPRLTVTLGLRYQLPGVADERDSLALSPVVKGSVIETLLSDATLDYAGKSVGRPWYNRRKKNFAPNFDFAWDIFGKGNTALRGGYAIKFVNDQELVAAENMMSGNAGLQGGVATTGLSGRIADGLPKIVPPEFAVPRTASDNYAINPGSVITMIDPNLNRPYVQQYNIGIQHDVKGTILEARYVGNHVVGAYRAFDYNQVQIVQSGFLADFQRAQNNGFLAAKVNGGTFNPNYNPNVSGSQPLTVFPRLVSGGFLNDPTIRNYLSTGEVAELATLYQVNGLQGPISFFPNPHALAADVLTNYSHSTYNSLQLEVRRRMRSGLSLRANYTYSKVLSNGDGDLQSRFQAFLDINNPKLERSRDNFDLNHMIKADGYYELPFGPGHRLHSKLLDRVIGGWQLSGTMVWQSGAPFSITSGRGTLNRSGRSYYNTANTSLTKPQLNDVVKFQMTGQGPTIVSQSALNPDDKTGVNIDGEPSFNGQIFSNPTAGTLGVLQRRLFSGPWTFSADLSVKKTVKFNENHRAELRMDAYNAFNHASFWVGDQNINSPNFGRIYYTFTSPRVVQFGLYYKF